MNARTATTFCLALAGMVLTAGPALAGRDCVCIGNGQRIKEGTVVCLQVSSSVRYLARCERHLNNTSWKKIQDGCPTASLPLAPVAGPVS